MRSGRLRNAAALAVALAFAGCDDSPTTPALFTTETFTGRVAQLASVSHNFVTGQASPVVITIGGFTPNLTMGLALGNPTVTTAGETCLITVGQAAVAPGDTFQVQLERGTYCVMIFDIGGITDPASTVSYSVTVQHR